MRPRRVVSRLSGTICTLYLWSVGGTDGGVDIGGKGGGGCYPAEM